MVLVPAVAAQGQTFKVLYNFTGGSDGGYPFAGLLRDAKGNLYGTTYYAGSSYYGVVFELPTTGGETVLYGFAGGSDGGYPYGGLVQDAAGNLYGTAYYAGASGYGVVYEVPKGGGEKVLYSFTGGSDGGYPFAGLALGPKNALYGNAYYGGTDTEGTVFEVVPNGTEKLLYSFNGSGGEYPFAGLVCNTGCDGLFGVTEEGGAYGYGTVFEFDRDTGAETVLYSFTGGADGGYPVYGYLARDAKGNLYGTTSSGGSSGAGTVFKVTPGGKETVLYSFTGGADGGYPYAGLVLDKKGNLYGTTGNGGANSEGTVFKLTPGGTEKVLHSFDYSDGAYPYANLVRSPAGNLYGTAVDGGTYGYGVVFEVIP
jgi:uncharacterized repeat protein (TIGR03803 family)